MQKLIEARTPNGKVQLLGDVFGKTRSIVKENPLDRSNGNPGGKAL